MNDLSRLVPELGVLLVFSGFFYKLLNMGLVAIQKINEDHKTSLNEMNKGHQEAWAKVADSLDRSNETNELLAKKTEGNTQVIEETVKYLKHRNGTFEALVKDAPALHELAKKMHRE